MNEPIFLTGTHRSGTTWLSSIISRSKEVNYIMEPFSDVNHRPWIFNTLLDHYYPYISHYNSDKYYAATENVINYKFDYLNGIKNLRGFKDFIRFTRDMYRTNKNRMNGKRCFIKDPNGLLMANWLFDKFNMKIIIMIRHPAAFVSSLKALEWNFPFETLLKQEQLMSEYFSQFETEMTDFCKNQKTIIEQGTLAWNILHHYIAEMKKSQKEWLFIKHEDISINLEKILPEIFEYIELDYTPEVLEYALEISSNKNPQDTTSTDIPVHHRESIRRDAKKNVHNWKKRLTLDEIDYIKSKTDPLWRDFYSVKSWA